MLARDLRRIRNLGQGVRRAVDAFLTTVERLPRELLGQLGLRLPLPHSRVYDFHPLIGVALLTAVCPALYFGYRSLAWTALILCHLLFPPPLSAADTAAPRPPLPGGEGDAALALLSLVCVLTYWRGLIATLSNVVFCTLFAEHLLPPLYFRAIFATLESKLGVVFVSALLALSSVLHNFGILWTVLSTVLCCALPWYSVDRQVLLCTTMRTCVIYRHM